MAKILVVEDSNTARMLFEKVLAYFKHDVLVARDGQEAIQVLKDHGDTELIITDLLMPNMSGEEFIRLVRSQENYRHIPIVVVSTEAAHLAGSKDVQAVLEKPFLPSELNQTILDALAQRPAKA